MSEGHRELHGRIGRGAQRVLRMPPSVSHETSFNALDTDYTEVTHGLAGAVRAIDKAQTRAAGISIQFNSQNIPLPSFSSVLTLYVHGEQPDALLKRADEALHHAKQRGRAQSVVALAAN